MLSAASVLDARTTARNIVAGKSTNTSSGYGINFTWSDIQSTPLGTQLDKPDAASAQDGLGQADVDFIRGDRSLRPPNSESATRAWVTSSTAARLLWRAHATLQLQRVPDVLQH